MADITLIVSDCKAALRAMIARGEKVHSVVTDPPYGLLSIIKRFGKNQAAARVEGTDGSFARLSGGFMGRQWDGSGIENDPEFWMLVKDVLLPGGYLLAFSSPRTGHRMATAIEAAGFIMHPFIGWAYGSGLPKQKDAELFIDKIDPAEAEKWVGYAYGAQARKPALEPIYVAQKPFSESSGARNIIKHGVGAVDIDGCRTEEGRYPANLITDGSAEVWSQFPNTPGQESASLTGGSKHRHTYNPMSRESASMVPRGDRGSAARFFESYPFEDQTVFYMPKAGKEDRAGSKHPTVKPIRLIRALVRHVTPPGGTVLDPFAGTGTTAAAAIFEGFDAILIEREIDYARDIARRFDMELGALNLLGNLGF